VAQSSGYPLLDRAAQEAVARWRFRVTFRGGDPMGGHTLVRINFRLD
jgi:TonB family protein